MKAYLEDYGPLPRWTKNVYRCVDGLPVSCRQETIRLKKISKQKLPRNGIQPVDRSFSATIVLDAVLNRAMTDIVYGSRSRTYALPPTTVTIRKSAFEHADVLSVSLNDGLRTLQKHCF